MRPTKLPRELLYQKVWGSLRARMDPKTHLVHPSWLLMMREFGVSRARIAEIIQSLKFQGRIRRKDQTSKDGEGGYYYEVEVDEGDNYLI